MRHTIVPLFALAFALAVPPQDARSADFCANTSAQLQAALTTANSNGEADVIRLNSAVFSAPTNAGFEAGVADGKDLTIEGGYFSFMNPCNFYFNDPTTTILDGANTKKGLQFVTTTGAANITVRNLTLIDHVGAQGTALYVPSTNNYGGDVLVDRVIFTGNQATLAPGALYVNTSGNVTVRNSLFAANTAVEQAAFGLIAHGDNLFVANNTVADNVATNPNSNAAAVTVSGTAAHWLSNNIIRGNTTGTQPDLHVSFSTRLLFNVVGLIHGNAHPDSTGNLAIDPLFQGAGDYRLRSDSPLVNYGLETPPGGVADYDLDGMDRVIGQRIDIGAYESDTLFTDGFQETGID